MQNQTKKAYQTPSLTTHGDAAQLTQSVSGFPNTDRQFPSNTPVAVIIQNTQPSP